MKRSSYMILAAVFMVLIVLLLILNRQGKLTSEEKKEETANASCDYFNGEVMEKTAEYVIVKPVAQWEWKETTRVKIPAIQLWEDDRGEEYSFQKPTKLFAGNFSDLKPGDQIRVAYNAKSMEWSGEEVLIKVVFMIYPWNGEEADEK